jgi:hypothetical protein
VFGGRGKTNGGAYGQRWHAGGYMKVATGGIVLLASLALVSHSASQPYEGKNRVNRIDVRQFEMAYTPGKAGAIVRLTLSTGRVVEYRVDDSGEADSIARLGSMFMEGRARMTADVDNATVLGVQVSGPVGHRVGE